MSNPIERFSRFIAVHDSGCHLWTGSTTPKGYGQFKLNDRPQYAHRMAYLFHYGRIPNGTQIDHLCRVKNCVNPQHLEAVTASMNVWRAKVAGRTTT